MSSFKILFRGIFSENPVLILGLGLCSSLAATARLEDALFMSVMVSISIMASNIAVSFFRKRIPRQFRLISYMMIIVASVTVLEQLLRVFFPDAAQALGPYVSLIVTNCVVMGRMEAFSANNPPKEVFFDSLGVSLGYSLVLIIMAAVRELFGNGTLLGLRILPESWETCRIFSTAPGAFIVFAFLLFCVNSLFGKKESSA
ncbi:MAG: electron transport complex subunit RsxE [Candidatus Riflebacteria bacterium]|nr:electron transport complex subunit RsxE [Candidatus Riflebacteria bacterium]